MKKFLLLLLFFSFEKSYAQFHCENFDVTYELDQQTEKYTILGFHKFDAFSDEIEPQVHYDYDIYLPGGMEFIILFATDNQVDSVSIVVTDEFKDTIAVSKITGIFARNMAEVDFVPPISGNCNLDFILFDKNMFYHCAYFVYMERKL